MKNLLGMAGKYHVWVGMVDTSGKVFGSRFWMHEQHSRLVLSFRLAKAFSKHVMLTGTRIIIHHAIRLTTKLHIIFLVNQRLLMKILDLGTVSYTRLTL